MAQLPKEISALMMSDAYGQTWHPKHNEIQRKVSEYFEETYNKKPVYVWHSEHSKTTCEKCESMDGRVFEEEEEAERLLPIHPNCKCWVEEVRQDIGELETYRNVADTMYREMLAVQNHPDVKKTETKYGKYNFFGFATDMMEINNAGSTMDFKPQLKTMADPYRNKEGHKVYGTIIPGDNEYIYDHDIWSNITYGYTWNRGNGMGFFAQRGGQLHDAVKWVNPFGTDNNAVSLGMELREKYGDNISRKDFEREIYLHRDELNRWKRGELESID